MGENLVCRHLCNDACRFGKMMQVLSWSGAHARISDLNEVPEKDDETNRRCSDAERALAPGLQGADTWLRAGHFGGAAKRRAVNPEPRPVVMCPDPGKTGKGRSGHRNRHRRLAYGMPSADAVRVQWWRHRSGQVPLVSRELGALKIGLVCYVGRAG